MPIKFKLNFKLEEPKPISELTPDRLHALFLSLFPPKIAEELHKPALYRPFSIWFPAYFKSSSNTLQNNFINTFTLIVSLLKEKYFSPLIGNLLEKRKDFYLGNTRVEVIPYASTLIQEEAFMTYEEIYEKTEPSSKFFFIFHTPVAFKKGKIDYPLPDPKVVFKSLLKKWNYFAGFKVNVDLTECLENKIIVVFFKIKTHKVRLSLGGAVVGFTGKVEFRVKEAKDEEVKWLCVLGNFSSFSGTGRKTTMGLGMSTFKILN